MREQDIDRSGIGELLEEQQRPFLMAFMMCVLADERIFRVLGPAVGPGGHIEGGAHFWRTIPPIVTGYTNPDTPPAFDDEDADYAAPLRRAHAAAGFSPELVAETVNWHVNILCELAIKTGRAHLVHHIVRAGKRMAQDFGCSSQTIGYNSDVLWLAFHRTDILPEMNGALWAVLGWPKLAEMLGHPDAHTVLETCREFLPERLVTQFATWPH